MKVIGIGNALVDVLTRLRTDSTLSSLALPRGSMQLISREFSARLGDELSGLESSRQSGGSAANTIHGIASLGGAVSYIGRVGDDERAGIFTRDLESAGITPVLQQVKGDTGVSYCLISPDGERTMATYLGAAIGMQSEDLDEKVIGTHDLLHIEGYLVQDHALVEKATSLAKAAGLKVSIDLASYNVVEGHLDFLREIVRKNVDIVFANEEEAKSFTGKDAREALDLIALDCEIAVVKTGKSGSLVKSGDRVYTCQAIPVDSVVDTTGAGDLYAAGFLWGYSQGLSMDRCASLGSLMAGNVITQLGGRIPASKMEAIKIKAKEIAG
jgi:sugar/nucleoside kinase (ribokinase family)